MWPLHGSKQTAQPKRPSPAILRRQLDALERNASKAVKVNRLTFPLLEGVAKHKTKKNQEFR
jgi:hypothetical protein